MKFEMKPYNQGVTDDELLIDIQKASKRLGENNYLSIKKYQNIGNYSPTTVTKHFRSWANALKMAGLKINRGYDEMQRITSKNLIEDLLNISRKLQKTRVTTTNYHDYGQYSLPTVVSRFGSWSSFINQAGLDQTGFKKRIDDIELFKEIERVWTALGKQPTTTDMKKGISTISLDTFTRRFGGWRKALIAFLEYVDEPEITISKNTDAERKVILPIDETKFVEKIKRTPRSINLKLRFRVLQRDGFKCCACGASPAKNPSAILHIDHIKPWSKGGETELDNLQTLCSNCNLGKSDTL